MKVRVQLQRNTLRFRINSGLSWKGKLARRQGVKFSLGLILNTCEILSPTYTSFVTCAKHLSIRAVPVRAGTVLHYWWRVFSRFLAPSPWIKCYLTFTNAAAINWNSIVFLKYDKLPGLWGRSLKLKTLLPKTILTKFTISCNYISRNEIMCFWLFFELISK